MKVPIFQVDAFADNLFEGNPAAVCFFSEWPEDQLLQKIAAENNLAETAFIVEKNEKKEIRWFTPSVEVDLCGHATLAAAHVYFTHLNYSEEELIFKTKTYGNLAVDKTGHQYTLNFLSDEIEPAIPPNGLLNAIGTQPAELWKGRTDYLLYYPSQEDIEQLRPDFYKLKTIAARGIIVTAPGYECDFVSRFFAPAVGINEDPVTGSAHTTLVPFWSRRMNQLVFEARQLSARGGKLTCKLSGKRVKISGQAVTFFEGTIIL